MLCRDDLGRMCVRVVAVDALLFRKQQRDQQYVDGMVERELNKVSLGQVHEAISVKFYRMCVH